MNFYKTEEFLENILSYIKFSFDKDEIKSELNHHMMDKIEYYIEVGYDKEKAEELSINDMGDPKVIGVELNKQHNPIIGWIWGITHVMVVLFMIINIFTVGIMVLLATFSRNPIRDIPRENIVYRIDLNEKVRIDDRVIKFTNVIYDKKGDLHIFYRYYDKRFWDTGWSFGSLGIIKDELGNEYSSGSGSGGGSILSKCRRTLRDFPKDAKTLIIDYDRYNRKYMVKVLLKVGENNE